MRLREDEEHPLHNKLPHLRVKPSANHTGDHTPLINETVAINLNTTGIILEETPKEPIINEADTTEGDKPPQELTPIGEVNKSEESISSVSQEEMKREIKNEIKEEMKVVKDEMKVAKDEVKKEV